MKKRVFSFLIAIFAVVSLSLTVFADVYQGNSGSCHINMPNGTLMAYDSQTQMHYASATAALPYPWQQGMVYTYIDYW